VAENHLWEAGEIREEIRLNPDERPLLQQIYSVPAAVGGGA
jgi:hypothetical protein